MRRFVPKSFRRLVLIGAGLVAAPLLLATLAAYLLLGNLAESRQAAWQRMVATVQMGREIENTLGAMKQAIMRLPTPVSPGPTALPAYRRLHEQYTRQLRGYAVASEVYWQRPAVERLIERAHILAGDFQARRDGSLLAGQIYQIDAETHQILHTVAAAMEQDFERGEARLARLRAILLAAVLVAALAAVVALLLFRWAITERICQLDRVIRDIGRTDFVPDIGMAGTPDFPDLSRRLDWLRRRLRNTETQRTRFLRHVSHDLKTPLTAICEGSQLLSEGAAGPLDPRQKPLVDIVNKNAHRLQRFIEDMLNYQQISSARVNLELRAIRMDKLCESVLGAHIMAIGKRNLRIRRNLPEVELLGDWNKLYAVVDNLVSNAIKFSPEEGTVTLSVADAGDDVTVEIIDQGKGVPEEERKRIFEPFFRGTRAGRGEVKGTGLGLAIARDYARAHRGKLELVDSEEGAHFRLTLPKRRGNQPVE